VVDCGHTCSWPNPSNLLVQLSSTTDLPVGGVMHINSTDLFNFYGPSEAVQISAPVLPPLVPPIVSVSVVGPQQVGVCGPPPSLKSNILGTAGRSIVALQWFANGSAITDNGTSTSLSLVRVNGTVIYTLEATNWLGTSGTSASFAVSFLDHAVISTSISAPQVFSSSTDVPISLSVGVQLPAECIPLGQENVNVGFGFAWTVTDSSSAVVFTSTASTLYIPASTLLPSTPGNPYYGIACSVTSQAFPLMDGLSTVKFSLAAAPLVVILAGGNGRSIEAGAQQVFDASQSCDPNLPLPVCYKSAGSSAPSPTLRFSWACLNNKNKPCSFGCQTNHTCAFNQSVLSIPTGQFIYSESPYTIKGNVSSTSINPVIPIAAIPTVTVVVLPPAPPGCFRPTITLSAVPPLLNLGAQGLVLPI